MFHLKFGISKSSSEKMDIKIEKRLPAILEDINFGVMLINSELEIIDHNRIVQEWLPNLDKEKHPLCHKSLNESAYSKMCSSCPTFRTLSDGLKHESIIEIKRNGKVNFYKVMSSPVFDLNNEIYASMEILEDVTEEIFKEKEIKRVSRTLRMLSDSNQALIHYTDEHELLDEICRIFVEVGKYAFAWVGYAEHDEEKTLRLVASAGNGKEYFNNSKISWGDNEFGACPGCYAIRSGQSQLVRNISTESICKSLREYALNSGYKSIIAFPLKNDSKTFGSLCVYANEIDAFDEKEVEILSELTNDLSFGINMIHIRNEFDQTEKALYENEIKLRTVYETMEEALTLNELIYDDCGEVIDYKIVEVNPAFEKDSGLSRKDVIGKLATEVYGMSSEGINTFWKEHKNDENITSSDKFFKQSQTWKHILISKPVNEKFVISYIDITKQKNIETALSQSEELHRIIADNSADIISLFDMDLNLTYISPSVEKIRGYTVEEALSQSLDEILTPESYEIVLETYKKEMYMERKGICDLSRTILLEIEENCKDGSTIWAELSASFIRGQDSKPTGIVTVARDITKRKKAKEALSLSETRFEQVSRASREIIWEVDAKGLYTYVSDVIQEILGYSVEEIVGKKHFYDLHPEEGRDEFKETAFAAFERKDSFSNYENLALTKDNRLVILSTNGLPVIDEQGNLFGYRGADSDITNRKQAETFREMSQEILQTLNESVNLEDSIKHVLKILKRRTKFDSVGIRLRSGDDYPYYTQEGFSEEFLETENTLLRKNNNGHVYFTDNDEVELECTCGLVISGKAKLSDPIFTTGGSAWTNDISASSSSHCELYPNHHFRKKCIMYGYSSFALIPLRVSDKIVGLIQLNDKHPGRFTLEMIEQLEGIASYIGTALMRKKVEDEIRRNEEKFRSVIEQSNDAIYILYNGKLELINRRFSELTGLTHKDTITADFRLLDFVAVEDKNHVEEQILMWESSDQTSSVFEFKLVHKNGDEYNVQSSTTKIEYHENKAVLGILMDISEQKKLEKQLHQAQKMESIGNLAGGIAHDFNNLLTPIIGNAELAMIHLDPLHPIYDDLQEITETAMRAADLNRQLLAYSRKQILEVKKINPNTLIDNFQKILRRTIREDIHFNVRYSKSIGTINVDVSQVEQILMNLFINAQHAMPDGGIISVETISIEVDQELANKYIGIVPGPYVVLSVRDTGTGMEKNVMEKIFDPFFTTKDVGKGTGLGLATVYGIVKQHGGYITVESEIGKGTEFKIFFPKEEDVIETANYSNNENTEYNGTETILIVEDNAQVREIATRILKSHGYQIYAANGSKEALSLIERNIQIDLLLTDVIMPNMNGKELFELLSEKIPGLKVLFMSGYTRDIISHHGVLEDGIDFIQKPLMVNTLLSKIKSIL